MKNKIGQKFKVVHIPRYHQSFLQKCLVFVKGKKKKKKSPDDAGRQHLGHTGLNLGIKCADSVT